MSVQLPTHYAQRAEQLEFASPQTIREALADPNTVVLDVRSDEEVEATGHLAHPKFAATSCHACRKMDETAHKMAPSKEARIVIYCRSGKRANVAKERLISMGYNEKNLLNAGGLADVLAILGQGERLL